jgi:MurNAc alpha-1-phosphate uridylyltransferase
MSATPTTAMLLAAGLGTRMRPLTNYTAKPLVEVAGKALIDWTIDPLVEIGVTKAVVNVHHHAAFMRRHLQGRKKPTILISDETDGLLDTGGGIIKALPLLDAEPFFVSHCDAILMPGAAAFRKLAAAWDSSSLDVVMLVHPLETAHGFDGAGDFFVESDGTMRRRGTASRAPYVYAGPWIVHPRLLTGDEPVPFSANRIWDRAIASGRMRAVINDGDWYHVGTPEAVPATTAMLTETVA